MYGINYGCPVNWDSPLNKNLISWWLSIPNWMGGTTFRDLCGRNHGTLTNMDPSTDWVGPSGRQGGFGALDFDGSNDYATISDSPSFAFGTGDFSCSCWFKTSRTSTSCLVSKWNSLSGGSWRFYIVSNVLVLSRGVSGSGDVTLSGATTVTDGAWHHTQFTRIGADYAIFLDGKSDATATQTAATMNNSFAVNIGRVGDSSYYFLGLIDDVRLSNIGTSPSKAWQLYTESRQGYPTLLNYVDFNDDVASTSNSYTITIGSGSYSITGNNQILKAARLLSLANGSYSITGQSLSLLCGRRVSLSNGSYSLTGNDVSLLAHRLLALAQGSYSQTGNSVGLYKGFNIQLNPGSYSYSGNSITLECDRLITLSNGSYSITGNTLILTYSGGPQEIVARILIKTRQVL